MARFIGKVDDGRTPPYASHDPVRVCPAGCKVRRRKGGRESAHRTKV